MSGTATTASYVLKHTEAELRRLEAQGAFLREPTRRVFLGAGITPGMRVLDVGCGAGDVSFLVAELVGPEGEVVGVDLNAEALSCATDRANLRGLANVRFVEGNFATGAALAAAERPFDAVVGRLVMVHQPDPAAAIAQLLPALRPGGILAFYDVDLDAGGWSTQPLPAVDDLWRAVALVERAGRFTGGLGGWYRRAFVALGCTDIVVIRTGGIEDATETGAVPWVAGFARSLAGVLAMLGHAATELDPATYEARLRAQVRETGAVWIPAHLIVGTARKAS